MSTEITAEQLDGPLYFVSRNSYRDFVCPVEFVRETKTQWIVKTPHGRHIRFRKKDSSEIGGRYCWLRPGELPPEGPRCQRSAEAKPRKKSE